MKKSIMASVLCLLAAAASANAQCSSWTNSLSIAANMGDPPALISTELSNGAWFVYTADSTNGVVGYLVDEVGVTELSYWDEDEKGTAILIDEEENVCTIDCNGTGGIKVTIAGANFDTITWQVNNAGEISMPGDTCGCSGGAGSGSQNKPCNTTTCATSSPCRVGSGSCQSGTTPNDY